MYHRQIAITANYTKLTDVQAQKQVSRTEHENGCKPYPGLREEATHARHKAVNSQEGDLVQPHKRRITNGDFKGRLMLTSNATDMYQWVPAKHVTLDTMSHVTESRAVGHCDHDRVVRIQRVSKNMPCQALQKYLTNATEHEHDECAEIMRETTQQSPIPWENSKIKPCIFAIAEKEMTNEEANSSLTS